MIFKTFEDFARHHQTRFVPPNDPRPVDARKPKSHGRVDPGWARRVKASRKRRGHKNN